MGFFLFLAQLCRTNKFYVSASVYIALSQFSDPEGRWFESSRAHHKKTAVFSHSGLFVWILICDIMCHKPKHIQYDFAGMPFSRFSAPPNPPQIRCLGRVSLYIENHSLGEWFKRRLMSIMEKEKLPLLYWECGLPTAQASKGRSFKNERRK